MKAAEQLMTYNRTGMAKLAFLDDYLGVEDLAREQI